MTPLLLALSVHSGDPELTRAVTRALRAMPVEVVGTAGLATERLDIEDEGDNRLVVRLTRGPDRVERELSFDGAPTLVDRAEAIALDFAELEKKLPARERRIATAATPVPSPEPTPLLATAAGTPVPDAALWPVERAPGGAGPPPAPRPVRAVFTGDAGVIAARDLEAIGGDAIAEYRTSTPFVAGLSAGLYESVSGRYGHTRLLPLDGTFGIHVEGRWLGATLEGGAELLTAQTDPNASRPRDLDLLTAIVVRGGATLALGRHVSIGLRAGASYTSDDEQYETASGGQRNFPHLYLRGAGTLSLGF